jgi:hypothetical protein
MALSPAVIGVQAKPPATVGGLLRVYKTLAPVSTFQADRLLESGWILGGTRGMTGAMIMTWLSDGVKATVVTPRDMIERASANLNLRLRRRMTDDSSTCWGSPGGSWLGGSSHRRGGASVSSICSSSSRLRDPTSAEGELLALVSPSDGLLRALAPWAMSNVCEVMPETRFAISCDGGLTRTR